MGNFYTNYTLRGPSQPSVVAALAGRSAFVAPSQDGCVVVFDEESEEQDQEVISELASQLSQRLACPVLVVLNHDDDILWYRLYQSGTLADEYDSSPGYFAARAEPSDPAGGDARILCGVFEATDLAAVAGVLRRSSFDDDGYAFAVERHADLARTLGIPSVAVGAGYRYIAQGEFPGGLSGDDLVRVT
jgi:hypothetical protein